MNQDFTVKKKQYSCTSSERKKKFVQAEKFPPPPPPHHFSNGPSLRYKFSDSLVLVGYRDRVRTARQILCMKTRLRA